MKTNKYSLIPIILLFLLMSAFPLFSEDSFSKLKNEDLPTLGPISSSTFDELTDNLEEILENNSAIRPLYWRYTRDGSIKEGHVDLQISLNIWASGALRQSVVSWHLELEHDPLSLEIIEFSLSRSNCDPFYPDELPEEYYLPINRAAELEDLIDKNWYENLLDALNIRNGIASKNGYATILNFANAKIYSGLADGGGSSGFSYELFKE